MTVYMPKIKITDSKSCFRFNENDVKRPHDGPVAQLLARRIIIIDREVESSNPARECH